MTINQFDEDKSKIYNPQMYKSHKILAFIPAKQYSERLPHKNELMLKNKPLYQWTLDAALECTFIDKVIISTDSEKIHGSFTHDKILKNSLRPTKLTQKNTSIYEVIQYELSKISEPFDYIIILQPTSPLRKTIHLNEAIIQFFSTEDYKNEKLVSVFKIPSKFGWLLKSDGRYVNYVMKENQNKISQEIPEYFLPNGAIYISKISNLTESFVGDKTQYFIMSEAESLDIDTQEDFALAEKLFQ
jgi:CMP-N,N'-diacetyllegionaminic acid synthase